MTRDVNAGSSWSVQKRDQLIFIGYFFPRPHTDIPGLRLHRCDGHLIEISSSELRQRVRAGLSLHYFCPQKVIAYIESRQLYR